jgi:hypothetical protein
MGLRFVSSVAVTFVVLSVVTNAAASAGRAPGAAPSPWRASRPATASGPSVAAAYGFLDLMMDAYATGSTLRLVQSFTGGILGQQNFTDSETYDDALVIDAYLTEGTDAGRARAEVVGNSLL